MDTVKQQVIDRLKQANNILVTVKNDPSVDLLSACIGLALLLDKLDKHAAAVFSGEVPSTMEFLKPEATLEKTPNSLRDFIIALDKSKADKLRYKVEDKVVRIFITPYKTSLTQDDLEFSQGDFNIDVVVALGVHEQGELDEAITAHGRILHDATVISINNTANGNLGSLNWQDANASSVAEMVADLGRDLGENVLDEQIATALLTGVVAETARFSNDKTSPQTMRIAGELMAAGANQQLVANELQRDAAAVPHDTAPPADTHPAAADNGELAIDHPSEAEPEKPSEPEESTDSAPDAQPDTAESKPAPGREILPMPEPGSIGSVHSASMGDNLFAGTYGDDDMTADHGFLIDEAAEKAPSAGDQPMPTNTPESPLLTHNEPVIPATAAPTPPLMPPAATPEPAADLTAQQPAPTMPSFDPSAFLQAAPPAASPTELDNSQTLEDIEESVHSQHLGPDGQDEPATPLATDDQAGKQLDDARLQVLEAFKGSPPAAEKPAAFNAQPLGEPLHDEAAAPTEEPPKPMAIEVDADGNLKAAADTPKDAMDMPLPPVNPQPSFGNGFGGFSGAQPPAPQPSDMNAPSPQAPPPVPPPMTPPSFM